MAPESIVLSAMIAVFTSTVSAAPRTADALSFVSCTTPRAVCAQPVAPASTSTAAIDHKAFMIPPQLGSERPIIRVSTPFGARCVPVIRLHRRVLAATMGSAAPMSKPTLPEEIEEHRDRCWRREATRQIDTAIEAERFIEHVGFAACLTDSRRPGPSLYVAVCGRRDAVMPRNVQKDAEASQTWLLKDDIVRRGKVYYAKLARGKTMFLAPRM